MRATPVDHRIRRALFDVQIASDANVMEMPARLEHYFMRCIEPGLNKSLEAHAVAGEVSIERLEIDLGTIDLERFNGDLQKRIDYAIRRALQTHDTTAGQRADNVAAVVVARAAVGGNGVHSEASQQFLHFLRTGLLRWDGTASVAELESTLMALPEDEQRPLLDAISEAIRGQWVSERLNLQLSAKFIAWLLQSANRLGIRLPDSVAGQLTTAPGDALEVAVVAPSGKRSAGAVPAQKAADSSSISQVAAAAEHIEVAAEAGDPLDITTLYVSGAGVCLLHPFLPALFKEVGLTSSDGSFFNETYRQRAIHLLSFLVSGTEDAEEPEMALYKVLCDWPLEKPVRKHLPLLDLEKSECNSVLKSCVRHWARLRNTSTDSLRTEFLQRDGRLQREKTDWRLVVEPKAVDLLLDSIPWSLSRIQLPWARSVIYVDWR